MRLDRPIILYLSYANKLEGDNNMRKSEMKLDILRAMCELKVSKTKGTRAVHIIGVLFGWYDIIDRNYNKIWESIKKMAAQENPMIKLCRIESKSNEDDPIAFECKFTSSGESFVTENKIGDEK